MGRAIKKERLSTGNSPYLFTTIAAKRWHRLELIKLLNTLNKSGTNTSLNKILGASIEAFKSLSIEEQKKLLSKEHKKDYKNSQMIVSALKKKNLW
jgi:hypothetical protein